MHPSHSCSAELRRLGDSTESGISGSSWLSQLSLASTPSQSSGCASLPADLRRESALTRTDSALFLSPFLPYVEIPPERGLQKYRSILRLAARKARKNLLKQNTHQCTIPEEYREQLKQIYVY
ncbi:uncharacterized protein LOC122375895 [Amphibalanus amphitrite]|uniref:uncharacterized protein LOC122375895 n=1 Tax=Amphibalanus amphitrite TaxID=1232801 RepID=UPI001C920AD9|nr:uncharacterized protein LOC122375895 [Amphibalanus amphitrite]